MRSFARWLPLLLALPVPLAAQQPDSVAPHKPARLFRAKDPLEIWLAADFKTVFKDRDSMSTKRFPATLRYLAEGGDTVTLDVQLGTRGHFRLRTCDFLPLKVYFDKEKTKGTLFGGEGSLKLTPHCMKSDRYTQNIYVEYAIYGMYNLLTPVSLKARLASITWIDPKNPKFTITRPGFWTQDEDDLAKELRGRVLMTQGGNAGQMEPRQMSLTDVFQYMIGNTDFSLSYLHNYRIIQTDTSVNYFPMAYDFDWSGLVDSPYANPDYRLGIKRTTDRLYRGGCHAPDVLSQAVQSFLAKRDSIYGTLRGIPGLSPDRLKEAESFLDEFYKDLNNPGMVRKVFNRPCP